MAPHHQKLLVLTLILLVLILVPFLIWEETMNAMADAFLQGNRPAIMVVVLLAADVLLPIPSSVVSTASGYLLGFPFGLAACWAGMTLGSILGYVFGRYAGRSLVQRFLSEKEMADSAADFEKRGDWMLMISRPIPMLAEASVIMAGVLARPFPRFFAITALANAGISAVYAAVGAFSVTTHSFLFAFFGAIAVPFIAMRLRKHRWLG